MAKIKMSVDVVDVFNQMIQFVNDKLEADEEVPRELMVLDIKAKMIASYLVSIGQYAQKTDNQELIELLIPLGIFKEGEENAKEENNIKTSGSNSESGDEKDSSSNQDRGEGQPDRGSDEESRA